MPYPQNPEALLREAILDKRTIIVAGTGVSIAASADPKNLDKEGKPIPHPQASWPGLLKNGLQWLIGHGISATRAQAYLDLLGDYPTTLDFINHWCASRC